MKMSRKSKFG